TKMNMRMKSFSFLTPLLLAVSLGCGNQKQDQHTDSTEGSDAKPVTLTRVWETAPVLTTCESVLYDESQNVLYVSNINGAPDGKDGNGFISRLSLEGEILDLEWVRGIDAPKGMGLHDGKLYVTDIDRVHEINTADGNITRTFPVEGATFLNDITVDNAKIYISDSRGGAIYLIEDGELSTFMQDLKGPNGLFADNGKLVVALWDEKSLNTLDPSSKEITKHTEGIENPDGIEAIGNNAYIVSSWNGIIHHIDSDCYRTVLLDTRQDSIYSADIEYVKGRNLRLVPTFFHHSVVAYEVR